MGREDVFPALIGHLGEFFEADLSHLQPEARMMNAIPGLDSLRLQEVLLFLEDRFGIEFDETVLDHVETVRHFADYIGTLRSARAVAAATSAE